MDLCAGLSLFGILLFVIALVGHGVWVLAAWILRALAGDHERRDRRPQRLRCARCATIFSRSMYECPACGLDPDTPLARELQELEITVRNIQAMVKRGAVGGELGENIYKALEHRQADLLSGGDSRVPERLVESDASTPVRVQIEQLLSACHDVRNLHSASRKQALSWYRQLREEDLAQLSAHTLVRLARILRMAGLSTRARQVYEILVRVHGKAPETGRDALEAARFAVRENDAALARSFLQTAQAGVLTAEEADEVQVLLGKVPAADVAVATADGPAIQVIRAESAEAPPKNNAETPSAVTPAVAATVPEAAHISRASWGELLAGFMEQRNILWGELVGGLLIVGCSVALVISLWQTLESIPYFPFLVFLAITTALFGAGLYTLRHWKLEATSRGLLVIATLLVPLDFLVLAGLTRGREAGPLDWGTEIAAVLVFTWMVSGSGRILVRNSLSAGVWQADWLLALAVVGASSTQLLVLHWLDWARPTPWLFAVLSLGPALCLDGGVGVVLLGLARRERLETTAANVLFLFVGQAVFAVGVALGFIVYWNQDATLQTLRYLAVPITAAALSLCVAGAFVQRKLMEDATAESHGLSAGVTRVIGTSIALAGVTIMLAALVLAWPRPLALLVVAGINAAVCAGSAFGFRLSGLHVPALACLLVVVLTGFHWLTGGLRADDPQLGARLLDLAFSPASGSVLTVLAAVLAGSSEWLMRTGRRLDGIIHIVAAGTAMVLALMLVSTDLAVPWRSAFVFAVGGLGTLLVNLRWRDNALTFAGSFVLLGSIVYVLGDIIPECAFSVRLLLALLLHASLTVGLGLTLSRLQLWGASAKDFLADPLRHSGFLTSVLALLPLAANIEWSMLPGLSCYTFWLAAIWLVLSCVETRPGLFTAFQSAVALAVVFALTAWIGEQSWVHRQPTRLLYVWSLQTYMLALAMLSALWMFVRFAIRVQKAEQTPAGRLLDPAWPTIDEGIFACLVLGQGALAVLSLWPEILREVVPLGLEDVLHRTLANFADLRPLETTTGWTVLSVMIIGLVLALWGRRAPEAILGLAVAALTAPVLIAHHFRDELAAASALRWGLAICFVACSALLWLRGRLRYWAEKAGISWDSTWNASQYIRVMLLVLCGGPIAVFTTWGALLVFHGRHQLGPIAESFFGSIGPVSWMGVPAALMLVGLIGHGVRENGAGYIFASGLLLLVMMTGGHALAVVSAGVLFDIAEGVYTVELGILTLSAWTLLWLWSGRWRDRLLLGVQCLLSFAGTFVLLLGALFTVLANARGGWRELADQLAGPSGWTALLSTIAAAVWTFRLYTSRRVIHVLASGGLGVCILAGCVAGMSDPTGWHAYHVLTLTTTLLALILLSAAWSGAAVPAVGPLFWSAERRTRAAALVRELFPERQARRWIAVLAAFVALLALGGAWGDPARPYWSSAATLAVSMLFGAMAVWVRRPAYVYLSGLLFSLVGYLVWQAWLVDTWGLQVWGVLAPELFDTFLLIQILCLGISSACWSLIELSLRRREPPIDVRGSSIPFAHAAALLGEHLLAILVLTAIVGDLFHSEIHIGGWLTWSAWLMMLAALALSAWDPEAPAWGLPAGPICILGSLALGLLLHRFSFSASTLAWCATVALSAYLLLVSLLVPLSRRGAGLRRYLHLPARAEPWYAGWFLPAKASQALLVLGLSLWMCLGLPSPGERLTGPIAISFLAAAGFVLARHWTDLTIKLPALAGKTHAPLLVLSLMLLGIVEAGWALLDADIAAPWLHRQVVLATTLVVFAMVYRLAPHWLASRKRARSDLEQPQESATVTSYGTAARQMASWLGALAALLLMAILIQEFMLYDPAARHTPMALPAVIVIAAILAGAMAGGIGIAVSRRNPLQLSDVNRGRCVWAAELLLVLLFVHLRLNVPDLIPSFLGRNWTLVLMTLAFLSVGIGEVCQRRGLTMLSKPLQQTGLFLPLLPVLAFLVRPLADVQELSDAVPGLQPILRYLERLPRGYQLHALLWFLFGMLYALVAVLRRASLFALLAALCANFGLWVIYAHHENMAFLLHPQIWLIPLGLILLAAEYLHRLHLTPAQSQTTRYAGLGLIYLSSTADMFVTGLGHSVVLPIVLAVLSTTGVLAGILLRVRAFLFMGIAFLFLVVFSQIWHAAVDRSQTWVWWASGIILGCAILTLFALFEKRRNDVVKLIDEIKRWH